MVDIFLIFIIIPLILLLVQVVTDNASFNREMQEYEDERNDILKMLLDVDEGSEIWTH